MSNGGVVLQVLFMSIGESGAESGDTAENVACGASGSEVLTLQLDSNLVSHPSKNTWHHGRTTYVPGQVISTRLDQSHKLAEEWVFSLSHKA